MFNFRKSAAYDADQKRAFHARARRQMKQLADALSLPPGSYDLRSNQGGIAVSGEITLHAHHLYVQVSQPATGHDTGVMFRTGRDRRDYVGGPNNFASLDLLNDPAELARRINRAISRSPIDEGCTKAVESADDESVAHYRLR